MQPCSFQQEKSTAYLAMQMELSFSSFHTESLSFPWKTEVITTELTFCPKSLMGDLINFIRRGVLLHNFPSSSPNFQAASLLYLYGLKYTPGCTGKLQCLQVFMVFFQINSQFRARTAGVWLLWPIIYLN